MGTSSSSTQDLNIFDEISNSYRNYADLNVEVFPIQQNKLMPTKLNIVPMKLNIVPIQTNIVPMKLNIVPIKTNVVFTEEQLESYKKILDSGKHIVINNFLCYKFACQFFYYLLRMPPHYWNFFCYPIFDKISSIPWTTKNRSHINSCWNEIDSVHNNPETKSIVYRFYRTGPHFKKCPC